MAATVSVRWSRSLGRARDGTSLPVLRLPRGDDPTRGELITSGSSPQAGTLAAGVARESSVDDAAEIVARIKNEGPAIVYVTSKKVGEDDPTPTMANSERLLAGDFTFLHARSFDDVIVVQDA